MSKAIRSEPLAIKISQRPASFGCTNYTATAEQFPKAKNTSQCGPKIAAEALACRWFYGASSKWAVEMIQVESAGKNKFRATLREAAV